MLLHAFMQDASMWDHQVAALSGRYRCLRPDLPGCGLSPAADGEASLDDLARRVWTVLDTAGADRVAIAGASMGGYLALALARVAPERVTGVALVGSRDDPDPPEAAPVRLALAARLRDDGHAVLEAEMEDQVGRLLSPWAAREAHITDPFRGRVRGCDPTSLAALLDAIRERPDARPVTSTLEVPALVVHGDEDRVIPPDEARGMAARLRHGHLETVAGAGHLVGLEAHEAVSAALAAWLERVGADA